MDKHYSYKEYKIDVVKEKTDQWKAHIRRSDGKNISREPSGYNPVAVLSTIAHYSAEAALADAKVMIDGGGMK
jgi:hypothetical protein